MRANVVKMQDVLRVKAVASYLRNFDGDDHRLQEILEITLCYGIHCLSRNSLLRGITVEQLRTVTGHSETRSQDFYVRQGGHRYRQSARPTGPATDPQQFYGKPPHSWRDGDRTGANLMRQSDELHRPGELKGGEAAEVEDVYFLPNSAQKESLDEIEFYTRLLGKQFMDTAWTTYSARPSAYLNKEQFDDHMVRLDQRQRHGSFPEVEFPMCSFMEFLNAYVKTCVSTTSRRVLDTREPEEEEDTALSHVVTIEGSAKPLSRLTHHKAKTNTGNTHPDAVKRQPKWSQQLKDVRSKVQPEHRVRRDRVLRVKKTQTQLMKEALARARLAEYENRQQQTGDRRTGLTGSTRFRDTTPRAKRMPLNKITRGAAALEIVDDFIRSPLMDKFGSENGADHQETVEPTRNDRMKEEIYGLSAHDDSFIGCKVPSAAPPRPTKSSIPSKTKHKPATRDYSGWLGDFGPVHTRTVHPSWEMEGSDADDQEGSPPRNAPVASRDKQRGSGGSAVQPARFEWNFDAPDNRNLKGSHGHIKDMFGATSTHENSEPRSDGYDGDDYSDSEIWSEGAEGSASDPVYMWLKKAV